MVQYFSFFEILKNYKYCIDRNGISSIKLEGTSRSFANAFLYFKINSLFFQAIKKQTAISAAMNHLT